MYGRGYLSEIAPTWAVFCPTLAFVVEMVYTLDKGVSIELMCLQLHIWLHRAVAWGCVCLVVIWERKAHTGADYCFFFGL